MDFQNRIITIVVVSNILIIAERSSLAYIMAYYSTITIPAGGLDDPPAL
jgi:hypothetical protein